MNIAMLATETQNVDNGASTISLIVIMAVTVVALYFLMWRPQKKKEKQATTLRNSIEVGDEVTTIGGIVGRVVNIKEDTFVIETAGDRSRMRFKRWAIQDVAKLNLESGETESTAKPKTEKTKTDKADKADKFSVKD